MISEQDVAKLLLDIEAVKVTVDPPFIWNTGLAAPIYTDNRLIISYPEYRKKIVHGFIDLIKKHDLTFDVIGGTASAAVPWASFLAYELDVPMVYIKKQTKGYGKNKLVEGAMTKGARILIVEDLISTGGSSIRAAESCKEQYQAQTVAVLSIFTYGMNKAAEAFGTAPFDLYSLSNFSTLVAVAAENGTLSEEEKQEALAWSADPESWSKSHGGV